MARSNGELRCDVFSRGLEPIFEQTRPDLVIHDMCPLRYLATVRFPECPRIHVTNVFLTGPAANETYQSLWFQDIGCQINERRQEKSLSTINSVFQLYEADKVVCSDPSFIARLIGPLPEHYEVCGPVTFEVDVPVPQEILASDELVIMSMGSTGPTDFAPGSLQKIRDMAEGMTLVYVGSSGSGLDSLNIFDGIFEWLPLHLMLDRARFVVTQGGTGSTYQSLMFGKPVVVLPKHRNHAILGNLIEDLQIGLMIADESEHNCLSADTMEVFRKSAQKFHIDQQQHGVAAAMAAKLIVDLL